MESIIRAAVAGEDIAPFIEEYRREAGVSSSEASDRLMVAVAERFLDGRLSYSDADQVANVWWALMCRLDQPERLPIPDRPMAIFEAFDAGEFTHRGDNADLDPVEQYTIPLLRTALNGPTTGTGN